MTAAATPALTCSPLHRVRLGSTRAPYMNYHRGPISHRGPGRCSSGRGRCASGAPAEPSGPAATSSARGKCMPACAHSDEAPRAGAPPQRGLAGGEDSPSSPSLGRLPRGRGRSSLSRATRERGWSRSAIALPGDGLGGMTAALTWDSSNSMACWLSSRSLIKWSCSVIIARSWLTSRGARRYVD